MNKKIIFVIVIGLVLISCGKEQAITESVSEPKAETLEEETTKSSISEDEKVKTDDKEDMAMAKRNVQGTVGEKNEMLYVMEGKDFRCGNWGDTDEEISKIEESWDEYEKVVQENQQNSYSYKEYAGTTGPHYVYYRFDSSGKLFCGESIRFAKSSEGLNNFFEVIYQMVKSNYGEATDDRFINCSRDDFESKIRNGEGYRMAGWDISDNTMIIEYATPYNDMSCVGVAFYDKNSDESLKDQNYYRWLFFSGIKEEDVSDKAQEAETGGIKEGNSDTGIIEIMTSASPGCDTRNTKIGDSFEQYVESEKDITLDSELRPVPDMPNRHELFGSMQIDNQSIMSYAYVDKDNTICGIYYLVIVDNKADADNLYKELKSVTDEKYGEPTKEKDMGFQVTTEYINDNGVKVSLGLSEVDEKNVYISLRFGDA